MCVIPFQSCLRFKKKTSDSIVLPSPVSKYCIEARSKDSFVTKDWILLEKSLIDSIMHGNNTPSTKRRFKMAIVIGSHVTICSHVTIYSHVQCHMAIFPPCLVFADFQFAAFTVFSIANLFYVTDGNIMYLTDASRSLISCVIQHYAPVVVWGGGGTDA